jgi:hypothetical protein
MSHMERIVVSLVMMVLLLPLAIAQGVAATNESSYKYGFKTAFGTYQLRVNGGDDGPPSSGDINADCISIAKMEHITNSTACIDGFIHGWKFWCANHVRDCAANAIPKPSNLSLSNHIKPEALDVSKYQINRGEVEGYNNLSPTSKNPNYISGFQQGLAYRNATWTNISNNTLPVHTDDNYKNFYIGYQDSQVQEDHDYATNHLHFDSCPSAHTQEYCFGWKAGYNQENWAQGIS